MSELKDAVDALRVTKKLNWFQRFFKTKKPEVGEIWQHDGLKNPWDDWLFEVIEVRGEWVRLRRLGAHYYDEHKMSYFKDRYSYVEG